jgi:hypothetical protein
MNYIFQDQGRETGVGSTFGNASPTAGLRIFAKYLSTPFRYKE